MDLIVRVKEIKGRCEVYAVGDTFTLADGFRLVADKPVCMHSLASLLPYYNALRVAGPSQWGLAGTEDVTKAYFQCLDPAAYTGGGTVIFEVTASEQPRPAEVTGPATGDR